MPILGNLSQGYAFSDQFITLGLGNDNHIWGKSLLAVLNLIWLCGSSIFFIFLFGWLLSHVAFIYISAASN